MKKIKYAGIIMAVVLAAALTGCSVEMTDPIEQCNAEYARLAEASEITQVTEVKSDKLAVYGREVVYTKEDGYYKKTDVERRLNSVESDEAYTVTDHGEERIAAAKLFVGSMNLSRENFMPGYYGGNNEFRARLKDGVEDEVFGLEEDHAEMKNVILEMRSDGERLTYMKITYTSDNNLTVSVSITFKY